MPFAFVNWDVYRKSLELVGKVDGLAKELKGQVSYPVLDQLTRAALSIPLNIAEGNGRWSRNERKHFFRIARGSVFEIVPIVQVLSEQCHLDAPAFRDFYGRLESLSQMLMKLIQSVDKLEQ